MSKPIRFRIWQSKKDRRWRWAEMSGNGRSTEVPGQGFASHAGVIRALERKYLLCCATVFMAYVPTPGFKSIESPLAAAIRLAIDAEMARWAKRKGVKA